MKIKVAIILMTLMVSGCFGLFTEPGTSEDDAKSLLETLEFDPDECGQFQVTGNVQAGTGIWGSGDMYVNLDKRRPCSLIEDETEETEDTGVQEGNEDEPEQLGDN